MTKKSLPISISREQLTNNWLYKLVAFFVAFFIWATMLHSRKDTILLRNMDLEFILKANHSISNTIERHVKIKVSGPRLALKKFSQSSNTIGINLTDHTPGEVKVRLDEQYLNLPTGVKLQSAQPEEIIVQLKEGS